MPSALSIITATDGDGRPARNRIAVNFDDIQDMKVTKDMLDLTKPAAAWPAWRARPPCQDPPVAPWATRAARRCSTGRSGRARGRRRKLA
jgi:hypothetical protein